MRALRAGVNRERTEIPPWSVCDRFLVARVPKSRVVVVVVIVIVVVVQRTLLEY
jgi:hypothetical protein